MTAFAPVSSGRVQGTVPGTGPNGATAGAAALGYAAAAMHVSISATAGGLSPRHVRERRKR
jgi:hypothetical protein